MSAPVKSCSILFWVLRSRPWPQSPFMRQARKALTDRQKELELKTQQLEMKLSNKIEEDIKKARRKSTQAGQSQGSKVTVTPGSQSYSGVWCLKWKGALLGLHVGERDLTPMSDFTPTFLHFFVLDSSGSASHDQLSQNALQIYRKLHIQPSLCSLLQKCLLSFLPKLRLMFHLFRKGKKQSAHDSVSRVWECWSGITPLYDIPNGCYFTMCCLVSWHFPKGGASKNKWRTFLISIEFANKADIQLFKEESEWVKWVLHNWF